MVSSITQQSLASGSIAALHQVISLWQKIHVLFHAVKDKTFKLMLPFFYCTKTSRDTDIDHQVKNTALGISTTYVNLLNVVTLFLTASFTFKCPQERTKTICCHHLKRISIFILVALNGFLLGFFFVLPEYGLKVVSCIKCCAIKLKLQTCQMSSKLEIFKLCVKIDFIS